MYTKQIDEWIDSRQGEMLEDLMSLIRIDSQKGEAAPGMPFGEGPAKVLDAAAQMMARFGLKVTDYDHYVVTGDYGTGEKELDILAHLDVVPVSEDDWTVTKPFEPVIRDGRVYGRGSIDDKGPAIAALYAIRAVKELGIPLRKSLRLILGSDEECGSSDLDHYYAIEKEAPSTFTPDASYPLINLEKARLAKAFALSAGQEEGSPRVISFKAGSKVNVVPATAEAVIEGIGEDAVRTQAELLGAIIPVSFTVTGTDEGVRVFVKGTAAHASTPELGQNAITALLALFGRLPLESCTTTSALRGLASLYPHGDTCGKALGVKMGDEISGDLTMNLGILELADGNLRGEFDVRAPLCATDENLTEVLRDRFARIGLTMEGGAMTPAHYVPADSPLVQTLLSSYEKYFGQKGEALAIGGGTYVHDLERGVAFGIEVEGIDNHMHGDDEFVDIDILVKSAKIFADAIVKICG